MEEESNNTEQETDATVTNPVHSSKIGNTEIIQTQDKIIARCGDGSITIL